AARQKARAHIPPVRRDQCGFFDRYWPFAGMQQVPSTRPRAAVQAARALTPSPRRSRIRELRIRNEADSTPYWRAPKRGLPITIICHLIGRQGAVQGKTRVFADSDVGQNTSIVGKRGSAVMQSQR